MANYALTLLSEILSCGPRDLEMLDKVEYAWNDVLDQLYCLTIREFGFNDLLRAIVTLGIIDIKEAIDDRICELEAIPNERALDDDEEKELTVLRELCPVNDIHASFNFCDTHIWFENNSEAYVEYLGDALDMFKDSTGFCIRER